MVEEELDSLVIIKKVLSSLPNEIKEQELICLKYSNLITSEESDLRDIENNVLGTIINENIENIEQGKEGEEPKVTLKKKYSNEDARKTEQANRLKEDDNYNKLRILINYNKNELEKEKIHLKFLLNRLSSAKVLVQVFSLEKED